MRYKPVRDTQNQSSAGLRRSLGWRQLVLLGVGTIVGSGIYTLIGIGTAVAGPSLILTFALAGFVCALAVLCYAELATMLPETGGAYTYAYAGLGEVAAWIVGWSLILEYSIGSSAVAVGWSAYVVAALGSVGVGVPHAFTTAALAGGIVNLPAVLLLIAIAAVLLRGTRASTRLNAVLVSLKLGAILLFVVLALPAFHVSNLLPFMPHGFWPHRAVGGEQGTLAAAAIVLFAFFGFDAVATTAEETRDPRHDVPFGLIGTIAACVLIYILVSTTMLGAVPASLLAGDPAPLATAMKRTGHAAAALLISGAAVVALPAAILGLMYAQSRLFFAMARDGLLPPQLVRIDERTGAPRVVTGVVTLFVAILAALLSLDRIVLLANAGALVALTTMPLALLALRKRSPNVLRAFRCPAAWLVAPLATVAGCVLFFSLSAFTLWSAAAWNMLGLAFYALYGRSRSRIGSRCESVDAA